MKRPFRTLLIAVIVVGLAGGVGWGLVRSNAKTSAAGASTAVGSQNAGGSRSGGNNGNQNGQGQGAGGFAGQRPAARGTVDSIAGNIVAVKTVSGTVKVNVGDSTTIRKTVTGSVSDLKAGETVTVSGTAGSDGTIAATAIQTIPTGSQAAGAGQAGTGGTRGQGQGTGGANGQTGQGQGAGSTGGQSGRGQGAGSQRPVTFGTIDSIEGNTVTVKTTSESTKVQVTDSTVIRKVEAGTIADIQVGQTITVSGTAGTDGIVAATAIQIGTADSQSNNGSR